jgi:hypothetical protein
MSYDPRYDVARAARIALSVWVVGLLALGFGVGFFAGVIVGGLP